MDFRFDQRGAFESHEHLIVDGVAHSCEAALLIKPADGWAAIEIHTLAAAQSTDNRKKIRRREIYGRR